LREWLDENPEAPISHRLRALMMVASALDEMHSGRQTGVPVAHGDVKPSNIIMREDGSSVLVDLGLTRIADGQGRTGRSRPYAAPELFVPGAVTTPEADRFAFVATLVHAALGETPPTAEGRGPDIESVAALMGRNPMTARRPLLTNGVLAALQSAPEGRPTPLATWLASLTDTLSQTTQPYSGPGSPTATPPKPRIGGRRLRLALAGAALVVLLLTASIGYALTRGGPPPVPTSAGQTQPAAAAAIAPSRTPGPVDSSPAASESPSPLLSPSDGAGPSDSAGPQPAVEPGADYFADGSKFRATDGTSFSTDPTNLNGQFYTQNLRFWVSHTGSKGSATFVLGRHYSRLKTVVGVDDSATSNLQVRIEIVADNVSIFRKDLAKGTAVTVDVPVTNIYSVNFSITELGGSAGYGVFADARVLR
jgi:serine/threonine protein kinase